MLEESESTRGVNHRDCRPKPRSEHSIGLSLKENLRGYPPPPPGTLPYPRYSYLRARLCSDHGCEELPDAPALPRRIPVYGSQRGMSFTLVHEDRVTSIDFLSYHNSQAALKNSSRSPAFTPLFCGCAPSYPARGIPSSCSPSCSPRSRLLPPGIHTSQSVTKGRSITSAIKSLLPGHLAFASNRISPLGRAGRLPSPSQRSLHRGEAGPENTGGLVLSHATPGHRFHDLLSTVLRVCVRSSIMRIGQLPRNPL